MRGTAEGRRLYLCWACPRNTSVAVRGKKVPKFFVVCLQTNFTETALTLISLNLSLAKRAGHRFPLSLAASTVGCTRWMKIEEASSDWCGCWAVVKHVPEPPSLLRQPPDQTSKTGRAPLPPALLSGCQRSPSTTA